MNKNKLIINQANNEQGYIVIASIVVLLIISMIIISGSNKSTTELFIAENDRNHKEAFHAADSGTYATPKLIQTTLVEKKTPFTVDNEDKKAFGGFNYTYTEGTGEDHTEGAYTFYRELAGFASDDDYKDEDDYKGDYDEDDIHEDLWVDIIPDETSVSTNIIRGGPYNPPGSGIEFGSMSEGAGVSAPGIYYDMETVGKSRDNARASIGSTFRYIFNVAAVKKEG